MVLAQFLLELAIYCHSRNRMMSLDRSISFFMPSSASTSIFSTSISTKSITRSSGNTASTRSTQTSSSMIFPFLPLSNEGVLVRNISAPPVFSWLISIVADDCVSEAPTLQSLVMSSRLLRQMFFLTMLYDTLQGSKICSSPLLPIRLPINIASIPLCEPRLSTLKSGLRKQVITCMFQDCQVPLIWMVLETAPSSGSTTMSKLQRVDTMSYLPDRGQCRLGFLLSSVYSQGILIEKVQKRMDIIHISALLIYQKQAKDGMNTSIPL